MGCGCRKKQDFDTMKRLAVAFSKMSQQSVQIYVSGKQGLNNIYNFEPLNPDRNNIIEIIQWEVE